MTSKHFVYILIFISFNVKGQSSLIDSLLNELDNSEVFNERYVDLANELSFEFLKSAPLKSPYYINLAISVAKEIDYNQGLIRATTNKGSSYWVNGLHDEALSNYILALSYNPSKYPLEFVRLNNNLGEVFKKKNIFDSAIKYYRVAIEMVNKKMPGRHPSMLAFNMGETYQMKGMLDSARFYYELCLKNSELESSDRGIAYAYDGLSQLDFLNDRAEEAINLQRNALRLRIEINDKRGVIISYYNLGNYYYQINKDSALNNWDIAERKALNFRALDLLNDVYRKKYNHFYTTGEFKLAAEYINSYEQLSDSLRTEEFISSIERIKTALFSELSEAENKLLKQQQEKEKEENRIILVIGICLGMILFSSLVIWRYYRKKKNTFTEFQIESKINESLLRLSKEVNVRQSDYDNFITDFLNSTNEVLKTHRASYWYVDEQTKNVQCYRSVNSGEIAEITKVFTKNTYLDFFKNLVSQRTIAVSDAKNDPRCSEFYEEYLKKHNVNSFLVSPLFLNDKYIGFISYSMIKEDRDWSFSDQRYVGSLSDILVTAFANNQNQLLEKEKEGLIEKLIKKNKSLKEFNSVISHNLREPLTQVIGFTSLLATDEGTTNAETKEIITRLGQSSERIDTVIKDLSTILNEHDPTQKDFKNFTLVNVINEVIEALANEVKKIEPSIIKELDVRKIVSYKPFLFDIIYHLLSNALKFSNPDKPLEIKISSKEDEDNYYLKISDNGRGMDLKLFGDRIFKMYMRHHHDVTGRGIGLYIVKNRVESINGKIEVKSNVMKGSTFTISLPKKEIS